MRLRDFELLKKFMNMAMSDNDNEALTALRQANKIIVANNLNWQRVLDRVVSVEQDVESAPAEHTRAPRADNLGLPEYAQAVNDAFELALPAASDSFLEFLESLRTQWDEKRFLSPAQREALFKAARRAQR